METEFTRAKHTLIVSDIHLADAEPPHPKNPLWKRFKRPKHFVDKAFRAFLERMQADIGESGIELVFNGDIFDFDSVMVLPNDPDRTAWKISWLERVRGLNSEEAKSRFKLSIILKDHPVWVATVRNFILKGNRVVFVTGNHDMEMSWPSVRQDFLDKLDLPEFFRDNVRFCEWFYISNKDTLIEHGHQYDAYCLSSNPINPLIKKGSRICVRIPFGNLAGKYMVNGMGLFNPHADSSFIKETIWEYVVFYFKYILTTQPFLIWTWFWSAMVTLVYSVGEGLLPPMTDPMTLASRVDDIANRANASPSQVWALKELHVHPAIYNPFKILRELWLDRAILLAIIVFASFNFFSFLRLLVNASPWWFVAAFFFFLPGFIFYARSVQSELAKTQNAAFEHAPLAARIVQVKRVAQGHVHQERHTWTDGVEYLNTGTWSPAYRDVECTQPYGRKCFVWIKPGNGPTDARVSELYEWREQGPERIIAEK